MGMSLSFWKTNIILLSWDLRIWDGIDLVQSLKNNIIAELPKYDTHVAVRLVLGDRKLVQYQGLYSPPPPPPPFSYVVMLLGAGVRGGGGVTWLLLSLQMYNRLIISQNNLTYWFLAKALLHHHLYCDNKRFVFYRKINTIMTGPSYQIKNGKQQIKF